MMYASTNTRPPTDLLEVALVEGADGDVVSQGEAPGVQLQGTLKAVSSQLPPRQEHVHQTPGEGRGGGESPLQHSLQYYVMSA